LDSHIEFVALIGALEYTQIMRIGKFGTLFFTLGLLGLVACAGNKVDENDPAALFKNAEEEVANDHYQMAIDHFRAIKNKFPYSKYAIEAQLRIADVYFLQDSFMEAASAYETFRDLHPKHEKTAYAMFRIGKSYFNDIPSVHARDLGPAEKSVAAYREFLKRYPNTPQAAEAQTDLKMSLDILAEKELYIADFYYKRDQLESAQARYNKLIALYPESASAEKAKNKLIKISQEKPAKEPLNDKSSQ